MTNFLRFRREGRGSFVGTTASDGIERLYTFTQVGDLPLVLNVALSADEIEAEWHAKALVIGALLLLCGLSVGLSLLVGWELRRRTAAEAELALLSRTDALTGLPNRRAFEETFDRAWAEARRRGGPISLLAVDADHFKRYNDRYGHPAGPVQALPALEAPVRRRAAGLRGVPHRRVPAPRPAAHRRLRPRPDRQQPGAGLLGDGRRVRLQEFRGRPSGAYAEEWGLRHDLAERSRRLAGAGGGDPRPLPPGGSRPVTGLPTRRGRLRACYLYNLYNSGEHRMPDKSVTTAEFLRHFGRYHDEARLAPLTLTKHGRPSLVVLSADTYRQLTEQADPRRAYAAGETPPELAHLILAELDRQSAEHGGD